MTPVFCKELIPDKVQWGSHVTAPIDVGMKIPLIVDQETVEPVLAANEPEFLDRAWLHLLDPGNDLPAEPPLPLHPRPVPEKNNPAQGQSQNIKGKKRKGKI
jgi:hypothetical protein